MQDPTIQKYALNFNEAVKFTGMCRSKLYEHLNNGSLVGRKLDGKTIFLRKELEFFLDNLPLQQDNIKNTDHLVAGKSKAMSAS